MKKIFLLIFFSLLIFSGCNFNSGGDKYSFVDFGINSDSREIVKASDGQTITWVKQVPVKNDNSDFIENHILMAGIDGKNQREVYVGSFAPGLGYLRIIGFYPEDKVIFWAVERPATDSSLVVNNEVSYKFLDSSEVNYVGQNYLKFFKAERGIMGLRIGQIVGFYQLSVNNTFALDTVANYNPDKATNDSCQFSNADISLEKEKVVYAFSCDPGAKLNIESKLIESDLEGNNRKNLYFSSEKITLNGISGNKVKFKVNDKEQEIDF